MAVMTLALVKIRTRLITTMVVMMDRIKIRRTMMIKIRLKMTTRTKTPTTPTTTQTTTRITTPTRKARLTRATKNKWTMTRLRPTVQYLAAQQARSQSIMLAASSTT